MDELRVVKKKPLIRTFSYSPSTNSFDFTPEVVPKESVKSDNAVPISPSISVPSTPPPTPPLKSKLSFIKNVTTLEKDEKIIEQLLPYATNSRNSDTKSTESLDSLFSSPSRSHMSLHIPLSANNQLKELVKQFETNSKPNSPSLRSNTMIGSVSAPKFTYEQMEKDSIFGKISHILLNDTVEGMLLILKLCADSQIDRRETSMKNLITVFQFYNSCMKRIQNVISFETTRQSDIGYRLVQIFTKVHFDSFVHSLLSPVLSKVFQKVTKTSRMKDVTERAASTIELATEIMYTILSTITESANPKFPSELRSLCQYVYFVSKDLKQVGNVVFHQFLCPAIVFPEHYQLIQIPITTTERKVLISVSSLLQKVSTRMKMVQQTQEANLLNEFLDKNFRIAESFLMQICTKVGSKSLSENVEEILVQVSEIQRIAALKQIHETLTDLLMYYPAHEELEDGSYLHIIRTQEIKSLLSNAKSREEYLSLIEKAGNVVVPIDWVQHQLGKKLKDMRQVYTSITVKQIEKDLQRDNISLNGKIFHEVSSLTIVLEQMVQLMLDNKFCYDKELALRSCIYVLQTCGRTSSAGDSFDAVNLIFSNTSLVHVLADQQSGFNDDLSPVVIQISASQVKAQQTSTYKVVDMESFDDSFSVFCKIKATTKWSFSFHKSKLYLESFGQVLLETDFQASAMAPGTGQIYLSTKQKETIRRVLYETEQKLAFLEQTIQSNKLDSVL